MSTLATPVKTAILTLLAALLASPALAADRCADLKAFRAKPETALRVATPKIRNDLPHTVLQSQRGRGDTILMGKIHVEKRARYKTAYKVHDAPGGGVCVVLQRVEVTVELSPVTIYIAKQSRPGGCEYKVTLEHERKHLKYERQAMAAQLKKLEGRIRATRKPFHAANERDAKRRAEKLISGWVDKALQNADRDAEVKHRRLDASSSSKFEAERCD
ncbi:MAG: hypothetical protein RIM84_02035 [Alphaproteobacteria bacterium]